MSLAALRLPDEAGLTVQGRNFNLQIDPRPCEMIRATRESMIAANGRKPSLVGHGPTEQREAAAGGATNE